MTTIKLIGDRENRAKGFYLLMVNTSTFSNKQDEFIFETNWKEQIFKKLKEKGILFKEI